MPAIRPFLQALATALLLTAWGAPGRAAPVELQLPNHPLKHRVPLQGFRLSRSSVLLVQACLAHPRYPRPPRRLGDGFLKRVSAQRLPAPKQPSKSPSPRFSVPRQGGTAFPFPR